MNMKKFSYYGSSTDLDCDDITYMCENSQEISYKTFLKNCDGVKRIAKVISFGSDLSLKRQCLFYKSMFREKICCYFVYEKIEYVFVINSSSKN
jgi:hypothetical protein